jgi:hypothetical protein
MELLRSVEDVPQIVGAPGESHNNRADMTHLIHVDFVFIPSYVALFVLVGVLLFFRGGMWRLGGIVVALLGAVAAIFDVLENLAILDVLRGGVHTPRGVSLVKWALIFIALALLARVYVNITLPRVRRAIGLFTAGVCWLASILGLAGVFFHRDPLVETGGTLMGISLLSGWLFFATHSVLANGVVAALDRLATIGWFRHLARWPSNE